MANQYLGDNLIPGVNVKNINAGIINPLMQLGGQIGTAYDQYGKGLRSVLNQDQDAFAQQFLAGKLPGQQQLQKPSADIRGSITPGSSEPAASNLGEGAAMDAAERHRAGAGFPAGVTRPSDYPISSSTKKITSEDSELPSTPTYNAKERVEKYGVKKAEDMAMMEWAEAHKGLAEKVKPGQAGYDAIQLALGKTTVEPEEIRAYMDDTGRSAEDVRGILGQGTQVETLISGDKPDVKTIGPIPAIGGSEVEIPAGNFSEMSQSMQDLVAPSLEAGAAFNINVDNVMNQDDPQAFLMEQLKKIQGSIR